MKKDRLYTVNKGNKKALGGNLFVGGGLTTPTYNNPYQGVLGPNYSFGLSGLQKPQTTVINWSDPRQTQPLMQEIDSGIKSLGDSNVFNQYEGGKSSKGSKGLTGTQILGLASGAASGIGAAFQDTPQYSADAGNGFGLVDNFIAQGTKTKGGTALVNTGASLMNTGLASGNGALMLAGGIAGTLGTLWNAGWGTKKNEKNIASIENNTANMNTMGRVLSEASTTSDLLNGAGSMGSKLGFGTKDLVKGGWFSGDKAKSMGQKYLDAENNALAFQSHGLATGADNVDRKQDNMAMRNFAAFGGPLDMIPSDNNFGAIEYGFMNDYLTAKRRQAEAKNKLGGVGVFNGFGRGGCLCNKFAEGGPEDYLTYEDTRSDTTRQGYHEGYVPYGAGSGPAGQGPLGIWDTVDMATNATRPDSPLYNPNLITGVGPTPTKATNALEALQMVKAMKAAKAAQTAKKAAVTNAARAATARANSYAGKSAEEIAVIRAKRQAAAKASVEARQAKGYSGNYSHRFDATREAATKREAAAGRARAAREASKMAGKKVGPSYKNGQGKRTSNWGAITVDDLYGLGGTLFALGGDIQTQGGDYTTGMSHINAGGSHESNPNEGVQVGVDAEGTPNLVEEGETIFNDYVYSNRIQCDPITKEMFHIGKKRDITYAELSKKLEKEAAERPNDPLSRAALKVQMQDLAEQQERQKAEMENARVREAFEALTPEEQADVMNYAQQRDAQEQEAAAQEQAMQQEAMAQQAQMQKPSPEEIAMAEQQQMGQPMSQEEMMQQQMMAQQQVQDPAQMAMGGKVNKFAGTQSGSSKMHNAGTWKKGTSAENWNTYTRGGLRDYLKSIVDRINAAPTEEAKNAIRQEAINAVSEIQQAYRNAYQSNITPSEESEAVRTLQNAFQNRNGNAYFGNIADNIVLPAGHNTGDTAAKGWVDGYWGPRTSIRNWGSTEYGTGNTNYYQDISDLASQAGLTYAPNKDWTYGSKDNPYQLYGLSMAAAPTTITESELNTPREYHIVEGDDDYLEGDSSTWNGVGKEIKRRTLPNGDIEVIHAADASAQQKPADKTGTADEWEVTPNYKNEKLRYAGLFGPAVGLGMQALGIGRPDTSRLDAAVDSYRNGRLALADYKPIGNYLTYRPMDIWAEQNRLNANARATDRALMNNSSPVGTRMAGLLANEYNNQLASGQLYRQAQEYNNNLNERVQTFNRGTDQYNADAYNRTALANAEAINGDRQYRTQLGLQAAAQKMDADAGWYNGIYGNVAGLFKGISDLGRENAQHNMIAEMAADGIFGPMSPRTNTGRRGKYLTFTKKNSACKGGKINRKKG